MPRRTTRRKPAISKSVAEDVGAKKEKRSRNPESKKCDSEELGMGAGTSQSHNLDDLRRDVFTEHAVWTSPTLLLPVVPNIRKNALRTTLIPPLPNEPNIRKCSTCSGILNQVTDRAGRPTPLLQCSQCLNGKLFCECCLYPCSPSTNISAATCTNNSCQIVSMLLTCDRVTDTHSNVYGCPQFRACPKCYSLMMHKTGCKYVKCRKCKHRYCFICLQDTEECRKDMTKYWSLTCSNPRAERQRFQT